MKLKVNEYLFKKGLEHYFNIFDDDKLAVKFYIIGQYEPALELKVMDYLMYEKYEIEMVTLQHMYGTYVKFPVDAMNGGLSFVMKQKEIIMTTINRHNEHIKSIEQVVEQNKKWKELDDQTDVLREVIEAIKQTNIQFDEVNKQTAILIQEGKGETAKQNMNKVEDIKRHLSDLEYQKAIMSDQIIHYKKDLPGTNSVEVNMKEFYALKEQQGYLYAILNRYDYLIDHYNDHITKNANPNAIEIHNAYKENIKQQIMILDKKLKECENTYKVIKALVDVIDIDKLMEDDITVPTYISVLSYMQHNNNLFPDGIEIERM